MAIIFRTAGPWGPGQGSNLAAAQVDGNFWELLSRLAYLEDHAPAALVSIDYFSVSGSLLTIHMTDHSIRGPFELPVAQWHFHKEGWQPDTDYVPQDVFAHNGSAYLVLWPHHSAGSFDPGANDGMGHDFYGLLLTDPGDALPLGGAAGQVLTKRSSADLDMEWGDPVTGGAGVAVAGNEVSQDWPITTRGADYTLALSDAFSVIRMNVAIAHAVTVPPNSVVAFPTGTEIEIGQTDVGQTTIVAGAGVTINAPDGLAYDRRFRYGRLRKTATNTWSFAFLGFGLTSVVKTYTADHTLTLDDKFAVVRMDTATAVNLTVPPETDVAFDIATQIDIGQIGAGELTIVAGLGVTIHSTDGLVYDEQYRYGRLRYVAFNTWEFSFYAFGAPVTLTASQGVQIVGSDIQLDINGLTEDTSPDFVADYLVTYDFSASAHKKVKPDNLAFLKLVGGTLTGALTLAGDPVSGLQAATKQYVDNLSLGLNWKAPVLVATTGNITLSGEQTIDGVTTSASRVLVKDQATASQNGIYVSASGAWARASDMDAWAEVPAAAVIVEEGTANADMAFVCTSDPGGSLGSTAVTFTQFGSSVAGALLAANNLSDLTNTATARSNLGLGTAATHAASDFPQAANNLSDLANAGTARTNLGLGTIATFPETTTAQVPGQHGGQGVVDR
jgi:hypothetical protein